MSSIRLKRLGTSPFVVFIALLVATHRGSSIRPRGEGGFGAQRQKETVGVVNNDLNIEWGHLAGAPFTPVFDTYSICSPDCMMVTHSLLLARPFSHALVEGFQLKTSLGLH